MISATPQIARWTVPEIDSDLMRLVQHIRIDPVELFNELANIDANDQVWKHAISWLINSVHVRESDVVKALAQAGQPELIRSLFPDIENVKIQLFEQLRYLVRSQVGEYLVNSDDYFMGAPIDGYIVFGPIYDADKLAETEKLLYSLSELFDMESEKLELITLYARYNPDILALFVRYFGPFDRYMISNLEALQERLTLDEFDNLMRHLVVQYIEPRGRPFIRDEYLVHLFMTYADPFDVFMTIDRPYFQQSELSDFLREYGAAAIDGDELKLQQLAKHLRMSRNDILNLISI